MALSSATSSASLNGAVYARLQQQQAQRTAEQAEQNARVLQQRARQAEDEASQAQERARSIRGESDKAQRGAESARQTLSTMGSVDRMKGDLYQRVQLVSRQVDSAESASAPTVSALSASSAPAAVGSTIDVKA